MVSFFRVNGIYLHLHWAKTFVHLILEEISVYSTEIYALEHKIVYFCEHGPVLKHTRRPCLSLAPEPALPPQTPDLPCHFDSDPV